MKKKQRGVRCCLRAHRLKWGLSVKELAALVGLESASHLSRIEYGKRTPSLEVALACQVIFGEPPSTMFPHVYTRVEDRVMRSIAERHLALEHTTSLSGLRKRELFDLAVKRATGDAQLVEGV